MLSSLDALAGKISPGSGKNSPSQNSQQQQQQQQQQHSPQESIADQNHQNDLETAVEQQHQLQQSSSAPSQPPSPTAAVTATGVLYHGLSFESNCIELHQPPSSGVVVCQKSAYPNYHNNANTHPYQKTSSTLPAAIVASAELRQQLSLPNLRQRRLLEEQQQQRLEAFHQQLQQHRQEIQEQQLQEQIRLQYNESNDSQSDFSSCLKDGSFGMSDKSSTSNSLPNSPIHVHNNNNPSLLNNNSPTSNNNNNAYSTNRNVVMTSGGDDDSPCFRLTDTEMHFGNDKEPDPDNIKMFVGQVPKSMDETQLREMFEEYGPVHSINVLRDKATGISKGCCFVTFYTRRAALKAQDALHNVKTLNGMYHPIQMKPADSENRNERKLFVGMLNRKLNENDVRKLFEVHGAIEECTVLRDQSGQSKGCAFVTFSSKHSAISAIKTLNQNKTMDGCTSPLVVKFADTQKEKEQKKIQQIQQNLWNLASNITIPLGQTATTMTTSMMPNSPQQASPVLGADAITPASLSFLQQLQAVGLQQQLLQGLNAQTSTAADTAAATAAAAAAGLLPPMTVQNLAAIAAMTQPSLSNAANNSGNAQLTNTAALLCLLGKTAANSGPDPNPLASAYMSTAANLPSFGGASALGSSSLASVALSSAAAAAAGKQIEGPEGCNLFIYHLPQEFTDTDLASTFLPFGNVISAKVFIDKQTNLSKCFGFVSFDNPESAQVAIKAMNGFQVGTKRLKVQLKKPKDASKPY